LAERQYAIAMSSRNQYQQQQQQQSNSKQQQWHQLHKQQRQRQQQQQDAICQSIKFLNQCPKCWFVLSQLRPASQQQQSHQHDAILMKSATIVAVFHFWMEFSINEAIGNRGLRLVFTSSPACSNSSNSPGLCNDRKQPFFGHCSPTHQGRITCRPAPKDPSLATRQFP